ncbi:MAG: hypothetical protein IKJ56_06260 [Bacteroidales bacterium]|nr:hypothetical protein [Bacteroidales bacterium]
MNKYILFAIGVVFLSSCTFYGITNDYDKLAEKDQKKIIKLNDFNDIAYGNIYELNAEMLKKELDKYPKSIVYVFTNGCSSNSCKPLSYYKTYAEGHGYKLFFVMNGYANLYKTLGQDTSLVFFSIDADYYKERIRSKYTRYFENELMDLPTKTKHKEFPGSIFFFENGRFVNVCRDFDE